MKANEYDLVIIGAGQAAVPLAVKTMGDGYRVAVAERKHLGGSCVNFGCTPTKAIIASARVAHLIRRSAEFGFIVPEPKVDFQKVLERARAIVHLSNSSLARTLQEHNIDVLCGQARFGGSADGDFAINVRGPDGCDVRAKNVVINTGARTRIPVITGLDRIDFLHAGNWLKSAELPGHVVIAGAGYIALEMAQFYRRMGAQVTVIGPGKQVAKKEDPDAAGLLRDILEEEGIVFHLNTRVVDARRDGIHLRIGTMSDGKLDSVAGSHLFIATGRQPNTDDLGLASVGLSPNENGFIEVDERLATSVPGIWVAGDARGGQMLTNSSWDDYRVLESQLLGDGSRTTTNRMVPSAIFTDPELSRAGMTEPEARQKYGDRVKVEVFEMDRNSKAHEVGETRGFIKLIADARDGRILGATILANEGADLMASYVLLLNGGTSIASISNSIYIHPTLSEAMQSAVANMELTLAPAADNSLHRSGTSLKA